MPRSASLKSIIGLALVPFTSARDPCTLSLPLCVVPFMATVPCTSHSDCEDSIQSCQGGQCVCPMLQGWEGADVPYIYGDAYCNQNCSNCNGGVDQDPGANRDPFDPCRGPPPFYSKQCNIRSPAQKTYGLPMMTVALVYALLSAIYILISLLPKVLKNATSMWSKPGWLSAMLLSLESLLMVWVWAIIAIGQYAPKASQSVYLQAGYALGFAQSFLAAFSVMIIISFVDVSVEARTLPACMKLLTRAISFPLVLGLPVATITAFSPDVGGEDWELNAGWRLVGYAAVVLFGLSIFFGVIFTRVLIATKAAPHIQRSLKRAVPLVIAWLLALPLLAFACFYNVWTFDNRLDRALHDTRVQGLLTLSLPTWPMPKLPQPSPPAVWMISQWVTNVLN